jgi:hypothetical protein
MNRALREALGIPIHDDPAEHVFVDGYCTCGAGEGQVTGERRSDYAAGLASARLRGRGGCKAKLGPRLDQ